MDRELQIIVLLLAYVPRDKQKGAWLNLKEEMTIDQSIIEHVEYVYLS